MKEILASSWLAVSTHLERIEVLLEEWEKPNKPPEPGETLDASLRHNIARSYKALSKAADAVGAPITKRAADRARKRMLARKEVVDFKELSRINSELKSRLLDEVDAVRFYCLNPGASEFYSPDQPLFGAEVEARIPKASDDVSEAAKCFAVGRYTAAVFHLMRALEVALQKAGVELGLENVEIAWGPLLGAVHKKIEAKDKGAERDAWSEIQANLYHVKQAWRNDTMHPKATYTEEEAREVFDATKAFMRNLAAMLPPSVEELMS